MKYKKWGVGAVPLREGLFPYPLYLTSVKNAVAAAIAQAIDSLLIQDKEMPPMH
jgi:hypothetical protein